jgi:hypothetical protein
MIQQAINKGLSLAALVYSQTPAFKKGVRMQELKKEGSKVRKTIAATEGDTSSEAVKARTEAIEKGKQVAEEMFNTNPSKKTFEQYKQAAAYSEPAGSEPIQPEPVAPSSAPEVMAQRAQEHMAEKQTIKQRNFKNKSLRQKKKHGVI